MALTDQIVELHASTENQTDISSSYDFVFLFFDVWMGGSGGYIGVTASVCPSVRLSVFVRQFGYVFVSVRRFDCPLVHPSAMCSCLSLISFFIRPSVCLPVCLSVCLQQQRSLQCPPSPPPPSMVWLSLSLFMSVCLCFCFSL